MGRQLSSPEPMLTSKPSRRDRILAGVLTVIQYVAMLSTSMAQSLEDSLNRRRQQGEEDDVVCSLENHISDEIGDEEGNAKIGNNSPREELNLSPLQPSSNASTSSSVSVEDYAQPPLVSTGIKKFTFQEVLEATNQFSHDNFLGQGGFGPVYRGVLDGVGVVAIKRLQDGSSQGEHEFITEINVISHVHHRNLVSLEGYCISGAERLLVYEYVENNNLAFHLQGGGLSTPVLDWPTRMSIALGAAKGIAYLHEECNPRIIHRDIKSANILLDSNFRTKVADFGLAKLFPDDITHVETTVKGTLGYLAPDYFETRKLNEKSDVYSFGVVLLELITGKKSFELFRSENPLVFQARRGGKFDTRLVDPKLNDNYDYKEMNRMVTCSMTSICLRPDQRPRMSQVVQVLEGNISPEKLKSSNK